MVIIIITRGVVGAKHQRLIKKSTVFYHSDIHEQHLLAEPESRSNAPTYDALGLNTICPCIRA
jgi:hypothetical protein